MGELIDSRWHRSGIGALIVDGRLERKSSVFRNSITAEGCSPEGARGFKAAPAWHHLYTSLARPWAHRTLIMRNLKGLANIIGLSIVHWKMGDD
jgi:putative glutathione S-transferase